ncbi:MAG: hypothetical protein WD448_01365 [Woeseia sp.]
MSRTVTVHSLLLKAQTLVMRLPALACTLVIASVTHADVTTTDVQVAARALSFISEPLSGRVRVGIVYAANSAGSRRQAQELQALLSRGLRIGALELQPVLLEAADASSANVDLFFMTEHMAADTAPKLRDNDFLGRTLCVTTDIEQVRRGACVLGIQSQPKVEVFVNRSAAMSQGITFSTVFRVMITEL